MQPEIKRMKQRVREFMQSDRKLLELTCPGAESPKVRSSLFYYKKITRKNTFKTLIILGGMLLPAAGFKNLLYRLTGMKIGKGAALTMGSIIDARNQQLISIGEGTIIGTGASLLTHEATQRRIRIGRITIGRKVLIGGGSIIRAGTTIGDYAVIGAGSFVNRDVKPREFVGGVPIKRVKMLKKLI